MRTFQFFFHLGGKKEKKNRRTLLHLGVTGRGGEKGGDGAGFLVRGR